MIAALAVQITRNCYPAQVSQGNLPGRDDIAWVAAGSAASITTSAKATFIRWDSVILSIDGVAGCMHTVHMKRTNLVLDEDLLEEAVRVAGAKTYSATVNFALRDLVRRAKARRILELAGSGLWEGDLARMREDRSRRRAPG